MKIPALSTPEEFLAHAAAGVLENLKESPAPWETREALEKARNLAHKANKRVSLRIQKANKALAAARRERATINATHDALTAAILRMLELETA
jgi:hypothetical protein